MFAAHMLDRGGGSEATKLARALYHINSILKHNQLNNAIVGLQEVSNINIICLICYQITFVIYVSWL